MKPVREEVKKNVITEARCEADLLIRNVPYFIVWSAFNLRVWDKVYDTSL